MDDEFIIKLKNNWNEWVKKLPKYTPNESIMILKNNQISNEILIEIILRENEDLDLIHNPDDLFDQIEMMRKEIECGKFEIEAF